jgi:beta-xylosidase
VLGLQWQFNHNPVDSAWSLVRKAGFLALDALPAPCFKMARNTVSQKIMGYQGACTAVLDCSSMAEGQFAGLSCMGQDNHCAGVIVRNGVKVLVAGHESGVQESPGTVVEGNRVWLRLEYDTEANSFSFSFSLDGKTFAAAGDSFEMHFGFWKGARVALFSYNCTSALPSGTACFDSFDYRLDR